MTILTRTRLVWLVCLIYEVESSNFPHVKERLDGWYVCGNKWRRHASGCEAGHNVKREEESSCSNVRLRCKMVVVVVVVIVVQTLNDKNSTSLPINN